MDALVTKPLVGVHSGPVPQVPPRPTRVGRHLLRTIALVVALGYAAQIIELRPLELLLDLSNIGVFLKGYLNPSFLHVKEYAWQCVVTICIALWGTVLAVVIAVPLGLLGASNLAPHPLLYHLARRLMDLFRAVMVGGRHRLLSLGYGIRFGPSTIARLPRSSCSSSRWSCALT